MAARYWVGGSGNWTATNTANWSATSGGPGGASVPVGTFNNGDDIIFDANSGSGVVTVVATATSGYMRSFDTTGFQGSFASNVPIVFRPIFLFRLTRPFVSADTVTFQAVGGTIDIRVPTTFSISLGITNWSSSFSIVHDLQCLSISANNSGNGFIYSTTLDCNNITCTGNIGFATLTVLRPCLLTGTTVNIIQNAQNITSALSLSRLSFRVKTGVTGLLSDQACDKLFLDPAPGAVIDMVRRGSWNLIKNVNTNAFTLRLPSAFYLQVADWQVVGNPGGRVSLTTDGLQGCSLQSGSVTPVATDYLDIRKINVTPANTWYAGANSTDLGQNSGWIWGAAPSVSGNRNTLFFGSL
jgi:hypothetical protein